MLCNPKLPPNFKGRAEVCRPLIWFHVELLQPQEVSFIKSVRFLPGPRPPVSLASIGVEDGSVSNILSCQRLFHRAMPSRMILQTARSWQRGDFYGLRRVRKVLKASYSIWHVEMDTAWEALRRCQVKSFSHRHGLMNRMMNCLLLLWHGHESPNGPVKQSWVIGAELRRRTGPRSVEGDSDGWIAWLEVLMKCFYTFSVGVILCQGFGQHAHACGLVTNPAAGEMGLDLWHSDKV